MKKISEQERTSLVSRDRDVLIEAMWMIELIGHPDADPHNPLVIGASSSEEIVDRVIAHARAALAKVTP